MQLVSTYSPGKHREYVEFIHSMLKFYENDKMVHGRVRGHFSLEQVLNWIESKPFKKWCVIIGHHGIPVGMATLTHANEVEVSIHPNHVRKGYGSWAVQALANSNGPGKYYALLNPGNFKAKNMFKKLGYQSHKITLMLNLPV
jgi:GNAT superfamily N-acetyltransferase